MKLARVETPVAELRASWPVCDLIGVPISVVLKNVFNRAYRRLWNISNRESKRDDCPFPVFYEQLPLLGIESGKLDDSRELSMLSNDF